MHVERWSMSEIRDLGKPRTRLRLPSTTLAHVYPSRITIVSGRERYTREGVTERIPEGTRPGTALAVRTSFPSAPHLPGDSAVARERSETAGRGAAVPGRPSLQRARFFSVSRSAEHDSRRHRERANKRPSTPPKASPCPLVLIDDPPRSPFFQSPSSSARARRPLETPSRLQRVLLRARPPFGRRGWEVRARLRARGPSVPTPCRPPSARRNTASTTARRPNSATALRGATRVRVRTATGAKR